MNGTESTNGIYRRVVNDSKPCELLNLLMKNTEELKANSHENSNETNDSDENR